MLKGLRRGFYWARALRRSAAANVADALVDIRKMERIAPLRAYEKAFEATLHLRLGDYDATETMFAEVMDETEGSDRAKDKYVNLFSRFILAVMRGDQALEVALKGQADRVACSPALRRWLPK
jgi:hypothetical protein